MVQSGCSGPCVSDTWFPFSPLMGVFALPLAGHTPQPTHQRLPTTCTSSGGGRSQRARRPSGQLADDALQYRGGRVDCLLQGSRNRRARGWTLPVSSAAVGCATSREVQALHSDRRSATWDSRRGCVWITSKSAPCAGVMGHPCQRRAQVGKTKSTRIPARPASLAQAAQGEQGEVMGGGLGTRHFAYSRTCRPNAAGEDEYSLSGHFKRPGEEAGLPEGVRPAPRHLQA